MLPANIDLFEQLNFSIIAFSIIIGVACALFHAIGEYRKQKDMQHSIGEFVFTLILSIPFIYIIFHIFYQPFPLNIWILGLIIAVWTVIPIYSMPDTQYASEFMSVAVFVIPTMGITMARLSYEYVQTQYLSFTPTNQMFGVPQGDIFIVSVILGGLFLVMIYVASFYDDDDEGSPYIGMNIIFITAIIPGYLVWSFYELSGFELYIRWAIISTIAYVIAGTVGLSLRGLFRFSGWAESLTEGIIKISVDEYIAGNKQEISPKDNVNSTNPAYVASVAENLKSNATQTSSASECAKHLKELRDVLVESDLDGETYEDVMDQLDNLIVRVDSERFDDELDETRVRQIEDVAHRVERMCQRQS